MKVSRNILTREQVIAHNKKVIRIIKLLKVAGQLEEANQLISQYIVLV